eukprot:Polyplicarium_translucidae@DN1210_c0_g1_i2.p1
MSRRFSSPRPLRSRHSDALERRLWCWCPNPDAGHSRVTAAAVSEGYVERNSLFESSSGGAHLTSTVMSMCPSLPPAFALPRREEGSTGGEAWLESAVAGLDADVTSIYTDASYRLWSRQYFASMLKECYCRCRATPREKVKRKGKSPTVLTLPDGAALPIAGIRHIGEEAYFPTHDEEGGIARMLAASYRAAEQCRDSLRQVVVTGGTSAMAGFPERLRHEIGEIEEFESLVSPLVASDRPGERVHAAWVGSSILACLGTFTNFVVPRELYSEHGPQIFEAKCP